MRHKWLPAAFSAVVLLATACGNGHISSARGEERANGIRKTTAEVYWKLYNSISAPVSRSGGTGYFESCGHVGSTSARYVAKAYLRATSDKGVTFESLAQDVAEQLNSAGWHLTPPEGVRRSAEKGGVTVGLEPPSVGRMPMTVLQVKSECVDVGAASYTVVDGYYPSQNEDKYNDADASMSPIPTTFPSPMG